jgi:hypothetical protein
MRDLPKRNTCKMNRWVVLSNVPLKNGSFDTYYKCSEKYTALLKIRYEGFGASRFTLIVLVPGSNRTYTYKERTYSNHTYIKRVCTQMIKRLTRGLV